MYNIRLSNCRNSRLYAKKSIHLWNRLVINNVVFFFILYYINFFFSDPKVSIKILPLADDIITISVISSSALAIILLIIVAACWWSKSKYRQTQRLERKNSIRQSLHSLRSIGLSQGSFADPGYRRKPTQSVSIIGKFIICKFVALRFCPPFLYEYNKHLISSLIS